MGAACLVSVLAVLWLRQRPVADSAQAEPAPREMNEVNVSPRPLVWSGRVRAASGRVLVGSEVPSDESRRVIADELVVILPDGVSGAQIAAHYGADVVGEMPAVGAYRLRFGSADLAREARQAMAGDRGVTRIESNYVVTPPPAIALTGTEAGGVFSDKQLKPIDSDSPLVIGLVDTSVSAPLRGAEGFVLGVDGVAAVAGQPTHGDAVAASMMVGLSSVLGESAESSVKILPVDIYGGAATTSSYQVAQGVADAIEQGAAVVNLSLGSDAQSGLLQDVVAVGDELGVIFVGAAGNEPVTAEVYPAAYPEVLAVTSVEPDGRYADYANRGEFVDVGAPGLVRFDYESSTYLSAGTSMAAGVVSGMIAAVAEKEGLTLKEARERVESQLAVEAGDAQ
ncbi:S8 family serine peptidase [Sulfuriroseicoccus oceanibius]|uniref:S8 family serine peptidase n=1 Tax=Sulfuriroseicoccus oceanibius TaxID=2707525 RepID=A0A6B3LA72_9BACT|nr:S8 family serine peptidase [Sulfuriroseicoccus oceanibius]QQL45329.1 S8 family serine peptidase [Sulfuriroseicoccus oceanibius]